MSGTIFVLLMDPIVRCMHAAAPSLRGELAIGACADDLALVMSRYIDDLPEMLRILDNAKAAAAMTLNFSKCVVVPIDTSRSIAQHRAALDEKIHGFRTTKVAFFAKYLGVIIGPLAHEECWEAAATKLIQRSRWVRGQAGVCTSRAILAYQTFALGHVLFLAQLRKVSSPSAACLFRAERRAMAITLAAPFNAYAPSFVSSLSRVGLRDFPDIYMLFARLR